MIQKAAREYAVRTAEHSAYMEDILDVYDRSYDSKRPVDKMFCQLMGSVLLGGIS